MAPLNEHVVPVGQRVPRVQHLFLELKGAQVFSKVDLGKGSVPCRIVRGKDLLLPIGELTVGSSSNPRRLSCRYAKRMVREGAIELDQEEKN